MKAALIIDNSKGYRHFERDRILKKWGVNQDSTVTVANIGESSGANLFDENPTVIIEIEDDSLLKKTVSELEKTSLESFEETFSNGVILMLSSPRTKTKKIEAFFSKLKDSVVIIPPTQKDESITVKLVNLLNLQPEVRDYLIHYAGEDYENILSLIDSLLDIPSTQQSKVSIEDVYIRLPQPAGAIPAWEIENPIFSGNASKAIDIARRVNKHSSYILWLSILKNKMINYYKVSSILENNPSMKDSEITDLLGIPSKGFYFTKKKVTQYKQEDFKKALRLILDAEAEVKGYSSAPPEANLEILLIRLTRIFNK